MRVLNEQMLDKIESEKGSLSSNVVELRLSLKVKDEKIATYKQEIKLLEKRLKVKESEINSQLNTHFANEE